MKSLIFYILLAVITILPAKLFASEINLGMASNEKFTLSFDNSYFSTPSNTYNVTNVSPGNHHVRMTSVLSQMNGAYAMPQLLFDGWVNVPQNARLTAYAINYSQLSIVSVVPLGQPNYDPYNSYGNNYDNDYDNGNGYNQGYQNGNGYYGNNYGNGCGNSSPYQNNYGYGNNYPPVNYGMSAYDFGVLKNSINAQNFDSSKLSVAKQGIASNNITSAQVKELLGLFAFESSKLDIAKFAYAHTIDKNNYYQVNDAFTFSSSVDDLAGFINSYH